MVSFETKKKVFFLLKAKCIQNELAPHNIVARISLHYFLNFCYIFLSFFQKIFLMMCFIITVSELIIMHLLYSQDPSSTKPQTNIMKSNRRMAIWHFL